MQSTGVLTFPTIPSSLCVKHHQSSKSRTYKVRYRTTTVISSSSSPSSSSTTNTTTTNEEQNQRKFIYSRASPSTRWPHLNLTDENPKKIFQNTQSQSITLPPSNQESIEDNDDLEKESQTQAVNLLDMNDESLEALGRPSRTRAKKMTKLALKRAKDWRQRVQILTDKILRLQPDEFVADVLDDRIVQMSPTDYCFVVKWVGQVSWNLSFGDL